jgi:hypothetical protein
MRCFPFPATINVNHTHIAEDEIVALVGTPRPPVKLSKLEGGLDLIEGGLNQLHFALLTRYKTVNLLGELTPFSHLETIERAVPEFRKKIKQAKKQINEQLRNPAR